MNPWGPVAPAATSSPPKSGGNRPAQPPPEAPPKPEASPTFREIRDMLDRGDYVSAVRRAFQSAFEGTVRAYGLTVPNSCTDRKFLQEYVRPDMGKLAELLPELYRAYEPVGFGTVREGDRDSLRALLESLYTETILARIHDPAFQPSSLPAAGTRTSKYDALVRMLPKGGKRT